MGKVITLEKTYLKKFINEKEEKECLASVLSSFDTLMQRNGKGNEFTGWLDYYKELNDELLLKIDECAKNIRKNNKVLVVIGIGGSYLGSRAVLSALRPYYKSDSFKVIFVGNSVSSTYLKESLDFCKKKEFAICVISKSGTTTETSIAFRLFKNLLKEKYKRTYAHHIIAITDKEKGALREECNKEGYISFELPRNIGGRFSVFSPVGLIPMACADIKIADFVKGLTDASVYFTSEKSIKNEAIEYALIRNLMLNSGRSIEAFVSYEPKLEHVAEWWKQLFGESEGKDGKGLFPASLIYSRDLHSLGQYVQDGQKILFETVVDFRKPQKDVYFEYEKENLDGLNYLAGQNIDYVKNMAIIGTAMAHYDGNVPSLLIRLNKINAYNIAYLLYFFMFSCALSAYTLGVNPFDQPGVEAYKKNMFKLLKKPGY